ncbi:hypothetical protein CPC08DRAFT_728592 [Agrocybe pediades]|nr:hypothetical protein CPC08DRAFT_728592 [Agrocybe pediades]
MNENTKRRLKTHRPACPSRETYSTVDLFATLGTTESKRTTPTSTPPQNKVGPQPEPPTRLPISTDLAPASRQGRRENGRRQSQETLTLRSPRARTRRDGHMRCRRYCQRGLLQTSKRHKFTMRKGEMKSYDSGEPEEGWNYQPYLLCKRTSLSKGPSTPGGTAPSSQRHQANRAQTQLMASLQARGMLFIHPQTLVYAGMVIGESNKPTSLHLNPTTQKQLTTIRAAGADFPSYLIAIFRPPEVILSPCNKKSDERVSVAI